MPLGLRSRARSAGAGTCVDCPEGYYTDSAGASACKACDGGTFAKGTGNAACETCDVGYVSTPAAVGCTPCERGTFANANVCEACSVGMYNSDEGSDTCEACPAHATTTSPGAQSVDECECKEHFYNENKGAKNARGDLDMGSDIVCAPVESNKPESSLPCTQPGSWG